MYAKTIKHTTIMTLADEIRNSYRLSDEFIQKNIIPDLRSRGSRSLICDHHIREIETYAIPFRYGESLERWARENGFNVSYRYNSYGVRYIFITI